MPESPDARDVLGVRELRNHVSAALRRAESGERIVITVDGRPVAQLGPLTPPDDGPSLDDLIAAREVNAPTRSGRAPHPEPLALPVDVRVDDVWDDLRGR